MTTSTTFYLLILSIVLINGLEDFEIRKLCPQDKNLCIKKAARGECFGSSLKANVLQKQCQCSCDAVHHERIQTCCKTVGEKEMKFCLPLCSYNTTAEALGSTTGIKCVSQLTTWAYCGADNNDCTQCCVSKGVPPECRSFCQGKVPTCDMQSIFQYQGCISHMNNIMSCQKSGLGMKPRYDPNWTSSCEWEG